MKNTTHVCANFSKCKVVIKPEDPRTKIGRFTYCELCAIEKTK